MDWSRVPLPPTIIRMIRLIDPLQLIGIGRDIDQKDRKISVDIISQKKGVIMTTLSPHFKTGLVSIPIRNEFGQIGTEFRLWPFLRAAAEREQVMLTASMNPDSLYPLPGTLTKENLETLAEKVRGDVTMVVKFSPSDASDLTRKSHERYYQRYSAVT